MCVCVCETQRKGERERKCSWDTQAYLQFLFVFHHFCQINKLKKLEGKLTNVSISPEVPSFPLRVASSRFRRQGRRAIWLETLDPPGSK